ncbi:MAG: thioredoxin fold domain-containing protein, partial [Desulfosalsimonas sp.]
GFYELSLPQSWTETAGTARAGLAGALLMGLTVGIVAAPCIGPLVLGLMAYVAARSDPVLGFLLFFFLSLGLGTPYLFLALFSGKIKSLPRSGQWMDGVRHIFGLALAGAAVYFVSPLLPGPFGKAALPVFGIISAAYLLAVDRTANKVIFFRIFKTVLSVILIAVSAYALLPGDQAGPAIKQFSPRQYEKALDNRKKIVIFFHADWCIPCRELKNRTLSDPAVKKRLSRFEVFGVDLTRGTPPEAAGLEQEFGVRGVPTIVILDTEGRMANSIAGFVGPEEFLEGLGRVE